MTKKPYQDKEFLYDLYVRQKMTVTEIAKYLTDMGFPTTHMTIFNWLKKYNLLKNSRNLGERSVGVRDQGNAGRGLGNNSKKKGGYY